MPKLAGKVAVITGGNSGIGLSTARAFVREGADVVITGRDQDTLKSAQKELGTRVLAVRSDVSNIDDIDRLYTEVKARFGRIDVLFANAGISNMGPIAEVTPEFFDRHFDINVRGVYFTVQRALPLLTDGASVILDASSLSTKGPLYFSVYSASKAAVRSLARSFANELRARKIRVNVVSPGPIDTPAFDKLGVPKEHMKAAISEFVSQIPLGRVGDPAELASVVLFLASSDSTFVNGIELTVDGGQTQY